MLVVCLIVYIVLTIVAAVMQTVNYRKTDDAGIKALAVCAGAAFAVFIGYLSLGSSSSATGGFVYYINGVRAGSGAMNIGMAFFCAFMSGALSYGIATGVGYLFGKHRVRDPQEKKRPKLRALILSIYGVIQGIVFFTGHVSESSTGYNPQTVLNVLGVAVVNHGYEHYRRRQQANT